jgi:hypothetical protein
MTWVVVPQKNLFSNYSNKSLQHFCHLSFLLVPLCWSQRGNLCPHVGQHHILG